MFLSHYLHYNSPCYTVKSIEYQDLENILCQEVTQKCPLILRHKPS